MRIIFLSNSFSFCDLSPEFNNLYIAYCYLIQYESYFRFHIKTSILISILLLYKHNS